MPRDNRYTGDRKRRSSIFVRVNAATRVDIDMIVSISGESEYALLSRYVEEGLTAIHNSKEELLPISCGRDAIDDVRFRISQLAYDYMQDVCSRCDVKQSLVMRAAIEQGLSLDKKKYNLEMQLL